MLSFLPILFAFFLVFLSRLFFPKFNSWCNSLLCHGIHVATFVTADAAAILLPLAVVFCAAMENGSSRVSSLALLDLGFGITGRRPWTVQGLVSWFLGALWLSFGVSFDVRPSTVLHRWPFGAARRPHNRMGWVCLIPDSAERLSVLDTNLGDRIRNGSDPGTVLLSGSASSYQLGGSVSSYRMGGSSPFRTL
ncbi:hypothetical protein V6N12_013772 [Hibiscus sabdariffa]|uniref:Uncharacterized protein n=1 Tax=Hibiscus sabdariffa TaxID=183260 RepID=A0ABR2CV61_9ROSI